MNIFCKFVSNLFNISGQNDLFPIPNWFGKTDAVKDIEKHKCKKASKKTGNLLCNMRYDRLVAVKQYVPYHVEMGKHVFIHIGYTYFIYISTHIT